MTVHSSKDRTMDKDAKRRPPPPVRDDNDEDCWEQIGVLAARVLAKIAEARD